LRAAFDRNLSRRERQIKRWTREKKLALAEGRLATLKGISRRKRREKRLPIQAAKGC